MAIVPEEGEARTPVCSSSPRLGEVGGGNRKGGAKCLKSFFRSSPINRAEKGKQKKKNVGVSSQILRREKGHTHGAGFFGDAKRKRKRRRGGRGGQHSFQRHSLENSRREKSI